MFDSKAYEASRRESRKLIRRKPHRVCKQCGSSFTGFGPVATCSEKCHKERRANQVEKYRSSRPLTKEQLDRKLRVRHKTDDPRMLTCVKCNTVFKAYRRRKFCSDSCLNSWTKLNQNLKNKTPDAKSKRNAFLRNKIKNNPDFRLRCLVSKQVWRALKRVGKTKGDSTLAHLPYTIPTLKQHIESFFNNANGFTWDNHGKTWQIDHIIPQALFEYSSLDSKAFRDCWALSNLRPMLKHENHTKGARRLGYFDETNQGHFIS